METWFIYILVTYLNLWMDIIWFVPVHIDKKIKKKHLFDLIQSIFNFGWNQNNFFFVGLVKSFAWSSSYKFTPPGNFFHCRMCCFRYIGTAMEPYISQLRFVQERSSLSLSCDLFKIEAHLVLGCNSFEIFYIVLIVLLLLLFSFLLLI